MVHTLLRTVVSKLVVSKLVVVRTETHLLVVVHTLLDNHTVKPRGAQNLPRRQVDKIGKRARDRQEGKARQPELACLHIRL